MELLRNEQRMDEALGPVVQWLEARNKGEEFVGTLPEETRHYRESRQHALHLSPHYNTVAPSLLSLSFSFTGPCVP